MPASLPKKEKKEKKVKKEKKNKKKEKNDKKVHKEKTEPIEKNVKEMNETSPEKEPVVEKQLKVEKEDVKDEVVNETDIYGMEIEQDGGVHGGGSASSSVGVPTTSVGVPVPDPTFDVYASTRHPKLIPTTEFEERVRAQRDRKNARETARRQRRAAERQQARNG